VITVLSDIACRARKPHRCDLDCGELIAVGEVHHRQGCIYDGRCYTWRAHLHCHALSACDFIERSRLWDEDGLADIADLDLGEWSRAQVDAACDRQGWSPSHPSRERARALWQRFVPMGAPRMERWWWGGETVVPGTALEVRR